MIRISPGLILVSVLALSACGATTTKNDGAGTPAPAATKQATSSTTAGTPSASASSSEVSNDPQVAATALKAAVPQVGKIVKLTEDNDPNNLLGRPGQYDAATFMQDKRLKCSAATNFDKLSSDCGAKIERWASRDDAQARADDIQTKLKAYGLGAEYDYIRGPLLLRVAGALKPSQAKEYEAAFVG